MRCTVLAAMASQATAGLEPHLAEALGEPQRRLSAAESVKHLVPERLRDEVESRRPDLRRPPYLWTRISRGQSRRR
jgi:hypothetical protein